MIKLKSILKEGFAWERKADGSLPTLADTTAAYEAKIANEAQYSPRRKFGKGSPYNDEPDFFQPDQRNTKNIVNTNWDAVVDEYNSKPGFKVETNITPSSYVAKITNTETNNWWEVKFKYNEWSYMCQVEGSRKRYDSNTELINNFNEVNGLTESNKTSKPDYIDLDKDGNTKEPMKSAAKDIKEYGEDEFDRSSQMYSGGKSQREGKEILDLVSKAEDMVQNLRRNMATNSVLQRAEKMGYMEAFNELLDVLGDIGYQAEMDSE
jgi:hypothetical protein